MNATTDTGRGHDPGVGSLRIAEVHVDRFGGLADHVITLPDHPFVVLHGANEAGKSTLTECIAWLLAGPGGDAANAQRFGHPRDRIGGRLTGTLRDQHFVATGSFEVLQRGAPNDSGLTVRLDTPVSAADWRAALGGLDAAVLAAVYRLWGEQLHDGDGVEGHLSRIALAGVSGLADPRSIVSDLSDRTKSLMRSRSADADSVLASRKRIDELRSELRVAGSTADDHLRAERELSELRAVRDRAEAERAHHATCAATVRTVLGVVTHRHDLTRLRAELADVPPVPTAWHPLLDDPTAVATSVAALETATDLADRIADELQRRSTEVPIAADALVRLTITDADVADASRAETAHQHATEALATTRRSLLDVDGHAADARTATDRYLGASVDAPADRGQVTAAALDPTVNGQLHRQLERWTELARDAESAEHRAVLARAEAHAAAERAGLARDAWDRHGTGVPAEAWLQRRSVPVAAPVTRSSLRFVLPALVAAVAAVAAVVGEWISAGVALAAAVVGFVLALRPSSPAAAEPDAAAVERLFAAAQEVLDTERTAADRASDAAEEAARSAAAVESVSRQANAVDRAFADRGLPVPADPDHGVRILDAWNRATAALAAERELAARAATARRAAESAEGAVRDAAQLGADLLTRWGAPHEHPRDRLGELVTRLRAASDTAREAARRHEERERAQQTYRALIATVADEVGGQRPERVAERVHELAALAERRRELEHRIAGIERDRDARLGDRPAVRELVERELPVDELERLLHDHETAEAEAGATAQSSSEQVGRLETLRDELVATERVAALELALGTEQEHLADLVAETAAHALAARLLRDVAGEYERANQPAMVARATELARSVAPDWQHVVVRPSSSGDGLDVVIRQRSGAEVPARQLSTGARALLYLAFRIALAEHDATRRGVRLPLLCDDPLVHLDDLRAREVVPLLATAAADGHQVLLFTCHERTVHAAREVGAAVVRLDEA